MHEGWELAAFGQVDQLNTMIEALQTGGSDGQNYLISLWTTGSLIKKGKKTGSKKLALALLPEVQKGVEKLLSGLPDAANMTCCGFAIFIAQYLEAVYREYKGQYTVEYYHDGGHGLSMIVYDPRSRFVADSSVGNSPVRLERSRKAIAVEAYGNPEADLVKYSFRPFSTSNGPCKRMPDARALLTQSMAG
jgi:hypothetical protein